MIDAPAAIQMVLITGMSGSGKSVALHALEDAGYFCVDNLPPELLLPFVELEKSHHATRLAIAVDVRSATSLPLLPQQLTALRAQGVAVSEVKLLAAHRDAWRLANINPNDPLRAILCASEPLERFKLAVAATTLSKTEFSQVVADALAQLPHGARDAAILHLFETGAVVRAFVQCADRPPHLGC